MTDDRHFDQRDQKVLGPQTNVTGNLIYEPSPALPIPHQIPAPPPDFTGRKGELKDLLANFDKGATIKGLQGMGGIGKTALALVIAEKVKGRFPDGQIFIEMKGTSKNPLMPAEAMTQVIRAYHPTAQMPEDVSSLGGLYRSILSGKRTLLLLDNAANREQVEMLLPPTGCAMLITSRQKFTLPGLKARNMELLPPADSCDLLLSIANRIGDQADNLANLCGYLPIALRNAASLLAESIDVDVAEYAKKLKEAKTRLDLVDATFSLSYDLLPPNYQSQWSMLSVFPADFDRAGAAAVWEMDIEASTKALSDLAKWNLAEFDPAKKRYLLHDLARDFAASRLRPEAGRSVQQKHAEYYKNVLSKVDELYVKGGKEMAAGRDLFDREFMNIKAGQKWAVDMIRSDSNSEGIESALQLASDYASEGAYAIEMLLGPRERIRWLETALHAAKQLKNSKLECSHLCNLGIAYVQIHEVQRAIDILEQSVSMSQRIGNRSGELNSLGNLGSAYFENGEITKAIELFKQRLSIARKMGDRRSESKTLGNLGLAYCNLGNNLKAIEYLEQSLAISRKIGDQQCVGANLGNLGLVYHDMGDSHKAIEYFKQHLGLAKEIGDQSGEYNALCNLGNACLLLGETRRAIEYYEQYLTIAINIKDPWEAGYALNHLGNSHFILGEYQIAIEYGKRHLAIARMIGDQKIEGADLSNIGRAYSKLGETKNAIAHFEQQLSIACDIEDLDGKCDALFNLSLELYNIGQRAKAIESAKAALQLFEEIESPNAEQVRRVLAEWQK